MFEVLNSAAIAGKLTIVEDGFFTWSDREDRVTASAFFALNDSAAHYMVLELRKRAKGRPVVISLADNAREQMSLIRDGFVESERKGNTVKWRLENAPSTA